VDRESRRWGISVERFELRCFGLSERPHRTDLAKPLNETIQDEDGEDVWSCVGCVECISQQRRGGMQDGGNSDARVELWG